SPAPQFVPSRVGRYLGIDSARPGIDTSAHRLNVLEPLLAQPMRHIQRANAMMTNDNYVLIGIKFLMRARWNFAHRNIGASVDSCSLVFPRFAHIEQSKFIPARELFFDSVGINLVFHQYPKSAGAAQA